MPIELYTGLPGHGKTSLMMERLVAEAEKAQRPIWAGGIDGLSPGLAAVLSDPRDWNRHDPEGEPTCDCHGDGLLHAHVVPDGAMIFIDEAWKWFGHLQDASRQSTPQHVLKLAEHRHRGIDFVWTTQMPNQLFPFARSLVADHHHVVRRFGTQLIDVFTWAELNEEVKSSARREAAQRQTRALPTKQRDQFKSATIHTIKRKIPLRVLALPVLVLAGAICAWFAYKSLLPATIAENVKGRDAAGTAAPGDVWQPEAGQGTTSKPNTPLSPGEYVQRITPRVPAMPISAPVFDDREAQSQPEVYCMASKAGEDVDGRWRPGSVTCITEQGSSYTMPDSDARHVARWGTPYNPFRAPRREVAPAQQQGAGQRPASAAGASMGAPAPAPASGVGEWASTPPAAATMAVGQ